MEIIGILLLIVILVILINQGSNINNKLSRMEAEVHMLRQQLYRRETDTKEPPAAVREQRLRPAPVEQRPTAPPPAPMPQPTQQAPTEPLPASPPATVALPDSTIPPVEATAPAAAPTVTHTIEEPITAPSEKRVKPDVAQQKKIAANSDLEKFIGENLISKIGIGILVIAIGFFVKYAIDKNWVGETGRVGIGVLCGGILIALAHRMRNSYRAFSSVLAGGGLAALYFTITLAYRQFHLFSQPTSFAVMIAITAFAAVLSLLYNKQELAVIALVGGFTSPLLVSSGSGNYITLFSYLAVLNIGILVMAWYKSWRLLNLLAFVFTVLFFGTWLLFNADMDAPSVARNAFIFATIFYLLFFAINIAHNIKERKQFIASDFGILLANTVLFFSVGIYCMKGTWWEGYRGFFSAALGLFNLAASYFFFRKQKVDTNILYLLIGITLSFVSLTAPLQLHGNHITLFWATEAVLLYWLFTKSKIVLIEIASLIVWILMIASLLWDWAAIYGEVTEQLPILANRGFVTTLFSALATGLLGFIHSKWNQALIQSNRPTEYGSGWLFTVAIALTYIAGGLELHHQISYYYPQTQLYLQYLLLYTGIFVLVALWALPKAKRLGTTPTLHIVLYTVVVIFYLLCILPSFNTQAQLLTQPALPGNFAVHWLAVAAVAWAMARLVRIFVQQKSVRHEQLTWACCIVVILFISVELHLLANALWYSADNPLHEIRRVYIKTGLPIIWGLCSFVFMWLGMRHKYRPLRIVSLTLFTITLVKLFVFDIRNIPAGGKIAAFFCLGVLLLVVSFMYQRLKKIIIDNESKEHP
jgi:uncharacterized membrane protein